MAIWHFLCHHLGMSYWGLLFFMSLYGWTAGAKDLAEQDYRNRLNRLNKRYEGFFLHKRDQNRFQVRRKSGVPSAKSARQAYKNKRENARRNFVRVPPKDMEPLRVLWEAEQERLKKKREASRKRFSVQRQRLIEIESSAKKIPAMEELGLEATTETDVSTDSL